MIARRIIAVISYSEPKVDYIHETITRQGTDRVQAVGADIRLFVVIRTAQAIDEFVTDRAFGQTERLAGGTRPVYATNRIIT
jgi:hypothetical protein